MSGALVNSEVRPASKTNTATGNDARMRFRTGMHNQMPRQVAAFRKFQTAAFPSTSERSFTLLPHAELRLGWGRKRAETVWVRK